MDPSDKINILLVDDNQAKRTAIEAVLQHADYNLVKTESGREALRQLLQNEFAVLILDVNMPEMDGWECIRRIRAQAKFKTLPILAVTAKAMKGDREKCLAAGANGYITKPVDLDQLRSLMGVWLLPIKSGGETKS